MTFMQRGGPEDATAEVSYPDVDRRRNGITIKFSVAVGVAVAFLVQVGFVVMSVGRMIERQEGMVAQMARLENAAQRTQASVETLSQQAAVVAFRLQALEAKR